MFGKIFIDFIMAWNRLRHFGIGILVPIVFTAVTNQDTPQFQKLF